MIIWALFYIAARIAVIILSIVTIWYVQSLEYNVYGQLVLEVIVNSLLGVIS
jgi:hypothetical protein